MNTTTPKEVKTPEQWLIDEGYRESMPITRDTIANIIRRYNAQFQQQPEGKIKLYVDTIRSNFEMWRKSEIKDGALSFHLHTNLQFLESILATPPTTAEAGECYVWVNCTDRMPEEREDVYLEWNYKGDIRRLAGWLTSHDGYKYFNCGGTNIVGDEIKNTRWLSKYGEKNRTGE